MNATREDVMYYCALIGGFTTLMAGICFDSKLVNTGWSLIIIAAASAAVGVLTYLHTPKG